MSEKIVQLNEEVIKGQIKELVRGSVEETLNELLEKEAESLTQAARYERSEARQGYRSGHYDRNLTTTSGDVTLHVPRLKGVSFKTAIIERYRRRESSVEEALIEMYLAGVSVRRVEDITEALWGSKVSPATISELNKKAYVHIEDWRNRPLRGGRYPYVYVDGIYLRRNWGGEYENVAVLVAIAVNEDGFREVLGAAEGMKFTNAYTSSAICAPSRASVMTGLYAHKHGVIDNFTDIKEGTPLLGDCMHDAGYYCGYAGKWHVSPTLPPEGCGFDDGKPFMGYAFPGSGVFPHLVFNQPPDNVPNYYEEYLKENGFENVDVSHGFLGDNPNLQIQEMFCKHEGPVESTIEYFVAHETNRLIDKAKEEDKPFFIWANFWGPHSPSIVPEPYYSMYNPEDIPEHPSYCDDLLDKPYGYYLSEKMWGLGDYGWKGFQEIAEEISAVLGAMEMVLML